MLFRLPAGAVTTFATMISLHNVSMVYSNGLRALHSTDLVFEPGSFNVLLGRSGAGKSTLLRCINLLNDPTTGDIDVAGLGIVNKQRSIQRQHRRNTAMIFQQHQLIARHSALQNVLMGRLGHYHPLRTLLPFPRADKLFALECLDRVGLIEKALERADNLSGGQQQRVGIARGLAQKPNFLLADEPVASLDPATSHQVLSLLHKICKEDGLTAIVSLHQVELSQQYADRVIGLSEGHVVFDSHDQVLDEASINKIYSGDPEADTSVATAFDGASASGGVVTEPST
jgi:phosphonate transport system ATP-binding protein